jgi:hypothetical protein
MLQESLQFFFFVRRQIILTQLKKKTCSIILAFLITIIFSIEKIFFSWVLNLIKNEKN